MSSSPTRTVLVTGGTGFIGSHLLETLRNQFGAPFPNRLALPLDLSRDKYNLRVLARATSNRAVIPSSVYIVEGSLEDMKSLKLACDGVDVVIHAAADMTFYPNDEAHLIENNVRGAQNIVEAAHESGVTEFVFVSSYEAIGPGKHHEARNESSPPSPVYAYGRSKLQVHKYLEQYHVQHPEFHFTIALLPGVVGPDEAATSFHEQVFWAANLGLYFFVPDFTSNVQYCHVEDAVHGIILCLEKPKRNESFLLTPDDHMSFEEIIRLSCAKLERMQPFLRLPVPIVRQAVRRLKRPINSLLEKELLFNEKTVDQMVVSRVFSNEKAKEKLGFLPKWTMKRAVADAIDGRIRSGRLRRYLVAPVHLALSLMLIAILMVIVLPVVLL